jgi:septum formation protein
MLLTDLRGYKIILASGSPRRKLLMESAGLSFRTFTDIEVDEDYPHELMGADITEYLAEKKADAYPLTLAENEVLITADTIVCQGNLVLLKPVDRDDAVAILSQISENTHMVYTGVHLRSMNYHRSFVASTEVKFGKLSAEEIDYYIDNFKPYDKAGSYGIQEWIGYVGVEEIHGSYFNVMGLPIHMLYRELEAFINPTTQ